MVGRQSGVPKHDRGDNRKAGEHHLAGRAVVRAKPEQRRKRNADVESVALIKAKRARRIPKHVLEEKKAADRQRTDDHHNCRGSGRRVTTKQGHKTVHDTRACKWVNGAGGRGRTDTPFGNTILSRARLPIPPHRPAPSYSVKSLNSQTKLRALPFAIGHFVHARTTP